MKSSWSSQMKGSLSVLLLLYLLPTLLIVQAQTSFTFNQFNVSTLQLLGNASVRSNAISLNQASHNSMGRAFNRHPVRMKDPAPLNYTFSFSTTFIMTPNRSPEGLGDPSNHLFAVQFDTSKTSEAGGYWIYSIQIRDLNLKSGQNIQAWVNYDNLQNELKVIVAEVGLDSSKQALLYMKNLSLSNIVEEEMYVGFSAGRGTMYEENYILAWSFATKGIAPPLNTANLPSFVHRKSKSSISRLMAGISATACVVLVLLVVVASLVMLQKRNQYRETIEEWETEYWPHRFKYKDLHTATKGFREEQLLGSGGFSRVYRGVLPTSGLQVAVKCILRETDDGVKEFIAEISSLGRLQHRNLVQLRGFCRWEKRLFIVYDYMPNRSLDKIIFGNPKKILDWEKRYRILKDVASGLLYLHEEWEQCVVHRDIKSSNVLLDSELNGKLGDFGLARLYESNESSHTTLVVGTVGYIAPEFVETGKASTATDVFSFGVFMLEVACGRRPVDSSLQSDDILLVDWVRELHGTGSLMDWADPNLGVEYVGSEMERVLKLGLICSNPQPEGRLDIRQVLQILEEQAPLPNFDPPFPCQTLFLVISLYKINLCVAFFGATVTILFWTPVAIKYSIKELLLSKRRIFNLAS